jgi:sec-independent protein translocase protein TatA
MIPLIAGLGVHELLVILLICVVLFGAAKLPQIGRGLGEGIRNFKKEVRSTREGQETEDTGPEEVSPR